MKLRQLVLATSVVAAGVASALVPSVANAQAKEQFFPALVYRTGAYAPNGIPFANGAPNLTTDTPALLNLARERGLAICGKDFKTGQTFMKTLLAPGFTAWEIDEQSGALRSLRPEAERAAVNAAKTDIGWGHQIRSYVLDQSRIKDLRTNYETSNTKVVLDGDLDAFIQASLKMGV